jgi:hypothetical protein
VIWKVLAPYIEAATKILAYFADKRQYAAALMAVANKKQP